ncbi:MAG TPA: hypothetical protein VN758_01675 [Solirubrobacterales bacterium]|nr:hypothetical protein [Solirubrobacterales bacterium]
MKKVLLAMVLAIAASLLIPLTASAASYETFVGCDGLSENPVPSHVCLTSDFSAAYFESDVDTNYEVCIETPTGTELCSEEEPAEAEILYEDPFPSKLAAGNYFAYWYVGEIEVGSWAFRLDSPPPPPVLTLPAAPAPPPPAVALGPSAGCLKAQHLVTKINKQLKNAAGPKQKAKIRGKLRKAKSAAKRLC